MLRRAAVKSSCVLAPTKGRQLDALLPVTFVSSRGDSSLAEKVIRWGTKEDFSEYDEEKRKELEVDEQGEPFRQLFVKPNRLLPTAMRLLEKTGVEEKKRTHIVIDSLARRTPRCDEMPTDQDWPSVWPMAASFKAAAVPLPIRMGWQKKFSNRPPPDKIANLELVKIPNFLHLTPKHIERQCAAIKKFCTKWPEELKTSTYWQPYLPLTTSYSDYVHAGTSLRDMRSRIVTLQIKVSDLKLDEHANDKLIRLAGHRYDETNDILTIVTDRCYTRQQNRDYAVYLLTALYRESKKVEQWESLRSRDDERRVSFKGSHSETATYDVLRKAAAALAQSSDGAEKAKLDTVPPSAKDISPDAEVDAIAKHPVVERHSKAWEKYRNKPETVEDAREYGRSVRDLLGIPALQGEQRHSPPSS
uniref:Ribosomal protein S24/S35 mitochondrial conserved domain-containing protein n=1 Tax=Plectus sambesii TaxID=2011161 RepID=A0A914WLZ2_9BILA